MDKVEGEVGCSVREEQCTLPLKSKMEWLYGGMISAGVDRTKGEEVKEKKRGGRGDGMGDAKE